MPEGQKIQWRRGTAAAWTAANPVLSAGTPGFESDTNKFKVGDGVKDWKTLPYQGVVDVHAAPDKATPVDADEIGLADSAATPAFGLKKLSWANLKKSVKDWLMVAFMNTSPPIGAAAHPFNDNVGILTADPSAALAAAGGVWKNVDYSTVPFSHTTWGKLKTAFSDYYNTATVVMTNKTLANPLIGSIYDPSVPASRSALFSAAAGAVDYPNFYSAAPAASGNGSVVLAGLGASANVHITLTPKGTGLAMVAGDVICTLNAVQSLANKTLASPTINTPTVQDTLTVKPTTGGLARIASTGTAADIGLTLATKGSGRVFLNSDPVATKVPVPASATAPGQPGQVAVAAGFIYAYVGDGTTHSWVRSVAATW